MITILAILRRALGIDQHSLAREAGISQSTLSLIEKGDRQPAPDVAKRIAQAIGIEVDDLFSGEEKSDGG
jgi:transcriptional regulator with XRE-family HTH domain